MLPAIMIDPIVIDIRPTLDTSRPVALDVYFLGDGAILGRHGSHPHQSEIVARVKVAKIANSQKVAHRGHTFFLAERR